MATRAKRHSSLTTTAKKRQPSAARSHMTAHKRGYDGKWAKAAKGFLAKHRACVVCKKPATHVDHIRAHKGDMKLFWDRSNWQPMCRACHASKSGRGE